jgi:hypothetical protein
MPPTRAPTLKPTASAATMWIAKATQYEQSVVNTAAGRRGLYSDLVVNQKRALGGCGAWKVFVKDYLATSLITLDPTSIKLVTSSDIDEELHTAKMSYACNGTTAKNIVEKLLQTSETSSAMYQPFVCGKVSWSVGVCGVGLAPFLCVGCTANPCGATTSTTLPVSLMMFSSPCSSSTLEVFRAPTALSLFTVDLFTEKSVATKITSITAVPVSTSIALSVTVEKAEGSLVCAAFPYADSVAITDINQLTLQSGGRIAAVTGTVMSIVVRELDPAYTYDVYCASISPLNVPLKLESIVKTRLAVSTLCCREIYVQLLTTSFTSDQDVPDAVQITLSGPVPSGLTIQLATYLENATAPTYPFLPKQITIGTAMTLSGIAFVRQLTGKYRLAFTATGTFASSYKFVYSHPVLSVLQVDSPPAVPVMTSAVFARDGSSITVQFDSPTDKAGFTNNFNCKKVFDMVRFAADTRCLWNDASTVSIYTRGDDGVIVGDSVKLLPSTVKARCKVLNNGPPCSSWAHSNPAASNVIVTAPASPTAPTVTIVSAAVIGPCDSLTVDITSSTGAGGRSFKSIEFFVEGSHVNTSKITTYLNSPHDPTLPFVIPANLLAAGYAYNIVVKICNFINGCGRGSHSFVVSTSLNIPVVSLNSQSMRTMQRSSQLLISGRAFTSQCGGTVSAANIVYSWRMRVGGVDVSSQLPSTSNDPRVYLLAPYSLAVGKLYTLTLTALHTESLKSSTSSVLVTVSSGDVKAVISGASDRGLRADDAVTVDASASYDEDNNAARGVWAGLTFDFSCNQVSPSYLAQCGLIQTPGKSNDIVSYKVPSGINFVNTVHRVTVAVTGPGGVRTNTASITITIQPSLAPLVSIISDNGNRINPSQKLKLLATVELSAAASASWSVNDPNIQLSALALSSLTRNFPTPTVAPQLYTFSLVLAQDSLPQQSSFLFQLSVTTSTGHSTTAAITVNTNSPPLPGEYAVNPTSGVMVSTRFIFSASRFEDSDIPVTYEFSYQGSTDGYLVYRARLEKSFVDTDLPAGRASAGSMLSTRLQVFDRMDAKYVTYLSVKVEAEEFSASDMQSYLDVSLASADGYADGMKKAMAATSGILNSVNCSTAPDCSALNRGLCLATPGTCGECWDGYIGESGDANSRCMDASVMQGRRLASLRGTHTASSSIGVPCVFDSDCDESAWQVCGDDKKCGMMSKACGNNCNDAGDCVFVSVYNESMFYSKSECSVLNLHCKAVCKCLEGYAGTTCDKSEADFQQTLITRHRLAETIRDISRLEDPSVDTVVSWLEGLASLCSDPTGLRDDTKTLITAMAIEFVTVAKDLSLTFEDIASVGTIVDLVLNIGDDGDKSSLELLRAYNDFIVSDMAQGQNTVRIVSKTFRSSYYALTAQQGEGSIELSSPSTAFEGLLGATRQRAILPVNSDGKAFKVAMVETLAVSGNESEFASVPLGLRFDKSPCSENSNASECAIVVVLQNVRQHITMPDSNLTTQSHSIECTSDVIRNESYICPDGYVIWLGCNGSAGVVTSTCPANTFAMKCASIGTDHTTCEMIDFTASNITCRCSLPSRSSTRRRLQDTQSSVEEDSTVSVDVASVGASVLTTFVDTWQGAEDLNANSVVDSIQVLATVAFVGIAAVVFISYAAVLDQRDELQQKAEEAHASLGSVSRRREELTRSASAKVHPVSTHAPGIVSPRSRGALLTAVVPSMLGVQKPALSITSHSRVNLRKIRIVGQAERQQIQDALPEVLRPLPIWKKYGKELQMHHRWAGVICHYSPAYSRPLRVMSLIMNVLTMLFIEALTYNIAYPDDGSCETYNSELDCLQEESALSSESKCYWDVDKGVCRIKTVENDFERVILVAMLAAIISTPFAVLFQSLILFVLSAETIDPLFEEEKVASQRISAEQTRGNNRMLAPSLSSLASFSFSSADAATQQSLGQTFAELMSKMRSYREALSEEKKQEFDSKSKLMYIVYTLLVIFVLIVDSLLMFLFAVL